MWRKPPEILWKQEAVVKTANGLRMSPSVVCLLYRKRAGKTIWQVAQSDAAGYNRVRNPKMSAVTEKAEMSMTWQRKRSDCCEWDWRRSLFLSDSLYCDSIWSEAWDSGCQERR